MSSANAVSPGAETSNVSSKAYTIGGVPILFPFRAYPSQITMMDKIVKCLNKQHNCLLESPTGSGKSLALLCASLAWQKKIGKAIEELEQKLEMELNACGINIPEQYTAASNKTECNTTDKVTPFESDKNTEFQCCSKMSPSKNEQNESCSNKPNALEKGKRGIIDIDDIDDLDDFKPVKKFRCSDGPLILGNDYSEKAESNQQCKSACDKKSPQELPYKPDSSNSSIPLPTNTKEKSITGESSLPTKLPRIYFGTRTHKQIDQIIRELKKTPYKNSKMTILSSRERTCIHPEASRANNKNEACEELLKADGGPACKFYKMARTVSHHHPAQLINAFDLEDFVGLCKRVRACPYYSSRELLSNSDIVFCPYNYLVDPLIRSAMSINLKGSIVIMDEAHNIEDSARDAASSNITLAQLEESVLNLEKVSRHSKTIPECYKFMAGILSNLAEWLKSNINNLSDYTSFNSSAKVFSGNDLITVLSFVELGPDSFPNFQKEFTKILNEESESQDKESYDDIDVPKLLGSTLMCLKNLSQTLSYLYKNELVFIPDYRLVIVKSSPPPYSGRKSQTSVSQLIAIHFWCMNPAVAFSDFKGVTHSVIVASGTLSPLTSFQSELGIPFQITLEANHVVSQNQVWVGTISKGPNNCSLSATYHNAATFAFQDDIGHLVFQVCCVIPHGILCFLPSYGMLDKLVSRWQQTGMWDKLLTKKLVLSEPRKQSDFVQVITEFYEAVKESECCTDGAQNGALFLAVCRGKVSEGLDFADSNARAVITVGIPFPNIKDAQVDLKRKYNDMYSSKRPIMTGSEWYEIQAFRALNQALGRCIRHRDDFGALIIVDERFQKNSRYPNALSKWIRREIEHFPRFSDAMNSLSCFAERTGLKAISSEEQ